MPITITFDGPYAEVVLGHRPVAGLNKLHTFDLPPHITEDLENLTENWFEWNGDDGELWHNFDNIYHNSGPLICRNKASQISVRQGGAIATIGTILDLLRKDSVSFDATFASIPGPREDGEVGAMAYQECHGCVAYDLPAGTEFDVEKLRIHIVRFAGMCDLTEDHIDLWIIAGISYEGERLEANDVSGHHKAQSVYLGLYPTDPDDIVIPEGAFAPDFNEVPER
jgi:hypothetical protein